MKDFIPKIVAQDRITRCILRNELPVTAELAAEVAARSGDYLAKAGKPMAWAAEALGVSAETLAEVVAGPYQAAHEATIRALDRWLESELQRPVAGRFCKTGVAEKVMAAGHLAIQTGGMVLVTGAAGIGKTLAAQALAAETPGSIFLTVHAAGFTSMAVLENLALAIGRPTTYQTTASKMYMMLEAALRGTGRLLIVDEVHRLASRRKDVGIGGAGNPHGGAGREGGGRMKKLVENLMPPMSYMGLLVSALQATDDPERYARTLLSALVEAQEGGEAMEAFAPFVREKHELRLAGGEAAPRMGNDSPVLSPAGGGDAAGCCWAGARSSRRARPGIFEARHGAGQQASRESAGSSRPADGRAPVHPPLADGAAGQSSCSSAGPHRRGAGMMPAPLASPEAAIRAGSIGAAEAAGGWPVARVEAGTALETFSEAVGL